MTSTTTFAALTVTEKATGNILFIEGCDPDGYSNHQVVIPVACLSSADKENIMDGKISATAKYDFSHSKGKPDGYVNLGESDARHFTHMDFDNIQIAIRTIELGSMNADRSYSALLK